MEINILEEKKLKPKSQWEELKDLNQGERLARDMAADNIFENKTYISELNDLILAEKIEN